MRELNSKNNSGVWTKLFDLPHRLGRRRVPVIFQMTALECGAACLSMILSYHGRKTKISECRDFCGVGRDGLTAQVITQAARQFGLRVKAYSLQPSEFKHLPLPAIIHWNFNHFMILERWSPRWVEVVDPGSGRRRLTAEEFDAGFTGVALTFEPGIQFECRSKVDKAAWRHYLKNILMIPGSLGALTQIVLISLILQGLGLVMPFATKVIVDQILPLRLTGLMTILGLGLGMMVLSRVVVSYLRSALLIFLQARLDAQMMLGFFEHVLSLPLRFFQQRSSGDLLMRLGSNMMIRQVLTIQTMSIVLDGGFVLVYLGILLAWSPMFAFLALGAGIIQVVILLSTTRRIHDFTQRDLSAGAESQSYLVEALRGIATLKASGTEDRAFDRWSNLFLKQMNISLQRSHFSALVDTGLTFLRTFSPLLLLWVGVIQIISGKLTLGNMFALTGIANMFLGPLTSLVSAGQQLQMVGANLERISDVIEAEPEQDKKVLSSRPRLKGQVELRNVHFRYDPNSPWVLRDVSLTIKLGQKVALVGRTGSGKTTLAMLLLGLYFPSEGEILFDGIPLQRFDLRILRSQFGAVLQESFQFNGSIRQNIAFCDPGISLERVVESARLAAIDKEIEAMPMGYESLLSEGGSGLSGGQRQRLSIARALAHQPVILLLDEATSHLDVVTESQVDKNLSSLSCTRIVIAHRLSTIRNSDLILVLDDGRLVEQGTHEDLLVRNGYYAELVHIQLETRKADRVLLHDSVNLLSCTDQSESYTRQSLQDQRVGELDRRLPSEKIGRDPDQAPAG